LWWRIVSSEEAPNATAFVHAAPKPAGDDPLVYATWGLVVATLLLFLAALIPALGQFLDWVNRKKSRESEVIPILHGIRTNIDDIGNRLLLLGPEAPLEDVANIYYDVESLCESTKMLQDRNGLSLSQRLELYVMGSHLNLLGLVLSLIASDNRKWRKMVLKETTLEARIRESAIRARAVLLSLDRLDQLFTGVRKRYHGRTFTEEMIARTSGDVDQAKRDLDTQTEGVPPRG
jgi:hypothetical protein